MGLLAAAFALVVAAGLDLTRLWLTTPELRGPRDVARFRRAVCRQRWACLGVILLLVAAGAVFLVGLLGGWCRGDDVTLEVGAGVPLAVAEAWLKFVEKRVREVPAADRKTRAAWARVVRWWEKNPIPQW